jgi:hypothetical protein
MMPLKKLFRINSGESESTLRSKAEVNVPPKILENLETSEPYKDRQRRRSSIQIDRRYSNVSTLTATDCKYI